MQVKTISKESVVDELIKLLNPPQAVADKVRKHAMTQSLTYLVLRLRNLKAQSENK